jgi:hypothetical protein
MGAEGRGNNFVEEDRKSHKAHGQSVMKRARGEVDLAREPVPTAFCSFLGPHLFAIRKRPSLFFFASLLFSISSSL